MNKFSLILFLLLIQILSVSAGSLAYEDFSELTLDTNKWLVEHSRLPELSSSQFLSESYLDVTNDNFHNAQIQVAEGATVLSMTWQFQIGEMVELDIFYQSGSGNHEIKPVINDVPLDLRMRDIDQYNCGGCATSGNIGYWNGVSEVGNQLGTWHLTVTFLSGEKAKITFQRPDGTLFEHITNQVTYPAKFGMETLAGHNGLVHADYDNFIISGDNIIENTSTNCSGSSSNVSVELDLLRDQVRNLQDQMFALTNGVIALEQRAHDPENNSVDLTELRMQMLNITERVNIIETRAETNGDDIQDLRQAIRDLNDALRQNRAWDEQEINSLKQRVQTLENRTSNFYSELLSPKGLSVGSVN